MTMTRAQLLGRGLVVAGLLAFDPEALTELTELGLAEPVAVTETTLAGNWWGVNASKLTWYGPSGLEQVWQLGPEWATAEDKRRVEHNILASGGSYQYGGLAL